MNKKTIRDIDINNKRALVRVDFNVPLDGARIAKLARWCIINAGVPIYD